MGWLLCSLGCDVACDCDVTLDVTLLLCSMVLVTSLLCLLRVLMSLLCSMWVVTSLLCSIWVVTSIFFQRVISSEDDLRAALAAIKQNAGRGHSSDAAIYATIGVDVQEGTGFVRVRLSFPRLHCVAVIARASHVPAVC